MNKFPKNKMTVLGLIHSGPIRGRMTDTDGSWETPHPSSGRGLYGWSNTPIRHADHMVQVVRRPHPSTATYPTVTVPTVGMTDGLSVVTDASSPKKRIRPDL